MSVTPSEKTAFSGLAFIIGAIAVSVGMGYLFGAGIGWVVFGAEAIGISFMVARS